MKKLTKVRLVNWHYFANETIHIKNNTLITGQNATGKSTIVDAIAFVITAGDQIFNLAANEKSKRDLRGYVKCKLGIDNQEYLREGDVTGHVALEFYDEFKDRFFTIGTVIDAFGEIIPPKYLFYEVDGPIEERFFIDEEARIRTTLLFKKAKLADKIYPTRREAKLAFRSIFGSIHETYFSLLPKALAFKPIADVKDFIYHYLLEEKTLDVESIKESIHSYRDLEATLKIIKQKIEALDEIKNVYDDIQKNRDQKAFYEYFLKLIEIESIKDEIQRKTRSLDKVSINREKNKKGASDINHQLEILDERAKEIYALLQSDDTFKAGEIYDKEILSLTQSIDEKEEIKRYFVRRVEKLNVVVKELKTEHKRNVYGDLAKIDYFNIPEDKLDKVRLDLKECEKTLREIQESNQKESGALERERQVLVEKINEIYQTLKELDQHQLRYNPMVKRLQSSIEQGVKERFGVDISVHILAELLEITDSSWADTIEDYLGQQRFNLIVEPRYFDEALSIYNKIKDSMQIYGVGLVNTKKIQHYTTHQERSLASILTSENVDAQHYINMTLGNLIMVGDASELEQYPQAITRFGMVYRSYTVRSLYKNTEKPFIGKRAAETQLDKWRLEAKKAKEEYQKITAVLQMKSEENNAISALMLHDIITMLEAQLDLPKLKEKRKELVLKKQNLPKENLNQIREEYEAIKEEIRRHQTARRKLDEEVGKLNADELKYHEDILECETRIKSSEKELLEMQSNNLSLETEAKNLYHQEIQNASDKRRIVEEYQERISAELHNLQNLEDTLKSKQFKYTHTYNLSYPYGIEHMSLYLNEMNKLVKSELVKYETKVREAREAAERLFKEDFLAKLRNYIVTAQDEIKKINDTLQTIHFGDDTYEFIFPKSKDYGDYYDMVLADESMKSGTEIFNYDFEMKYQRQLEELFINLASEELNSQGAINKFTDYRTYMDYDIKIKNEQGDVILYSKVFKEKSGGETQVPFYVATLASFVRVFQQAQRGNVNDSIGLILFDEVFDKMDTSRIKSMMEFIQCLPVQIVLATPPQKMEVLSRYTDTTVVTLRDGKAARAYEVVQKY
ncbi:MAG: SbcC/MukB-like Walker B domain-containing protein [Candidatus Izemoplasmatales bacterium]|nr:SbcC/MukB-like Walker B domain-containing protein [Candidatus Izemoplasmatales bacterium]